jgi:aminoglycoside 3-N-acetyltransferase
VAGTVTRAEIRTGIVDLALAGATVCVHSSLSSFGHVEGGADAVLDAFVDEQCTLMVPTFSARAFALAPPEAMRPPRNGIDYEVPLDSPGEGRVFMPDSTEISPQMGAVAAAVLARPGRARGDHPLNSFSAIGARSDLVLEQRPLDVYAPLRILAGRDGFVLLIGVGLDRMTLLHLAEERAGRRLFRRWANGPDGLPMEVETGSCSEGFAKLEPVLAPLAHETFVGSSRWLAFPARATLEHAAETIRAQPDITHCGRNDCLRCRDAVAGGPRAT